MVVYLSPQPKYDPYSGETTGHDWSEPKRTEAPRAFVISPTGTATNDGTNQTLTESWILRIPSGEIAPRPDDRIEEGGEVYAQVGPLMRTRHPFTGWTPYSRVRLERVGG